MKKETSPEENVPATNPDGTPVTPEVTPEPQDGKSAGKEIQSLRAEKKALKDENDLLKTNPGLTSEEVASMVEKGVKSALAEKSKVARDSNLESAIARFKIEKEGFDSENDPEGEKFALVQTELDSFKLEGYETEEDFLRGIEKANTLAYGAEAPAAVTPITPSHTPTPGSSSETKATAVPTVKFSATEKEIFQAGGLTIEQATELKTKNPVAYARMIEE